MMKVCLVKSKINQKNEEKTNKKIIFNEKSRVDFVFSPIPCNFEQVRTFNFYSTHFSFLVVW